MSDNAKALQSTAAGGVASEAVASAKRTLDIEIQALGDMRDRLGESFDQAVETILECEGRVVVTGMGKSGQICRKMAATFASTGTTSFFLHAAEAVHGDLGMFSRGDVCIAISNSGTTRELLSVLPSVKRLQIPLIGITGDPASTLATESDILLDVSVSEEACPLGLAPTASTTATLAMGDALAVAVLEKRGFSSDDFALLHPGGALGQRLVRIEEIMHADAELPTVPPTATVPDTLAAITGGRLGVAGVVDDAGALVGVITDGDVRRGVERFADFRDRTAAEIMTGRPKTIRKTALAAEGLALMEEFGITSLFIVEAEGERPLGVVHLHDLLHAQVA